MGTGNQTDIDVEWAFGWGTGRAKINGCVFGFPAKIQKRTGRASMKNVRGEGGELTGEPTGGGKYGDL